VQRIEEKGFTYLQNTCSTELPLTETPFLRQQANYFLANVS